MFDEKVARLGQHVGKVDGALQALADDTRRKLMEQQQQQQSVAVASAASLSPTVRHHDFRRQQQVLDDMQRDLQQLRLECEAERSDWRRRFDDHDAVVERSRRQLIADIQNRLAADKMEILTRLTDEWRQLVASTDAKRGVQIASELARVNDHFADLERWLQGELGAAKRVIQVLAVETDGKLQALAQSVVAALSATANSVAVGDVELRVTLLGLQDAVGEATHRVQKKLATLEDVLPLEVKARQQCDDKLRRRVDSALKAAEAARTATIELGKQQKSVVASQIERKLDAARRQTEALMGASESKTLAAMNEWTKRWKEEEKREKEEQRERLQAVLEQKADREAVAELSTAQDRLREALTSAQPMALTVSSSRSEEREDQATAIAAVEDKVQRLLGELSDRHNELLDLLQNLEQRQQEGGARVEALQAWTTTHATECRAVYDYVTWSLEASALDDQVCRVVGGLVDRIADSDTTERVQRLERRVAPTPAPVARPISGNNERSTFRDHRSRDEQRRPEGDDGGDADGDALDRESLPDGYPRGEEAPEPMDQGTKSDSGDGSRGEDGGASYDDDDGDDVGVNDGNDAGYDSLVDAGDECGETDLLSSPTRSDSSSPPVEPEANFIGGISEGGGDDDYGDDGGDGTGYGDVDDGDDINGEGEQPTPMSDPGRGADTNCDTSASLETAADDTSADVVDL